MAHYDIILKTSNPPALFVPINMNMNMNINMKDDIITKNKIKNNYCDNLKYFNFNDLQFPSNIFICGPRASGKTTMLKHILQYYPAIKNKTNFEVVCITRLFHAVVNTELKESLNDKNISIIELDEYNHNIFNKNISIIELDEYNHNIFNKDNNVSKLLLIEDDSITKKKLIELLNTKLHNMTIIVISKFPMTIRTIPFHYKFCTYSSNESCKRRIYDYIFYKYFISYGSFDITFRNMDSFTFLLCNNITSCCYYAINKNNIDKINKYNSDMDNIDEYMLDLDEENMLLNCKIII